MKEIETFHAAKCLLRQPLNLQNIREMTLDECSNLKSLFSVSIAITMMLERLRISHCEELKHMITYEEEDHDHVNCSSIFPRLENLTIWKCKKLEFIFPFSFAGGLQKLKSIYVDEADELKYVFGQHDREDYLLNENENNDHHIDLPELETLFLKDVPNMVSICIKKSQLKCPSLQNLEAEKELYASMKRIETSHTPKDLLRQPVNLQNIREMNLYKCSKLKSLFSESIAATMILEKLKISWCDELKSIVSPNEEEDRDCIINYSSVFPELEMLEIWCCSELEFLFLSTFSEGLQNLKAIDIKEAPKLIHVFGGHNHEDNVVPIHLRALETLSLVDVPRIISMCARNYYLAWPSLQNITLRNCPELIIRPFPDLMVCLKGRQLKLETGEELIITVSPDLMIREINLETSKDSMNSIMDMQNLISVEVGHCERTEEIFNLEGIESEGPVTLSLQVMQLEFLHELRQIYKGPKNILSLRNLEILVIASCNKLRAIFSTSTMKNLPRLSYLELIYCEELVHIIEEDDYYETSAGDHSHQLYFPMLQQICIYHCYKLRSLFSFSTSGVLPRLETLEIEAALKLEEVFRCQQDDTQEMVMEHVFPNLSYVRLRGLPELRTICGGIDFQSVPNFEVFDCHKYGENGAAREELHCPHYSKMGLDSDNQEASETSAILAKSQLMRMTSLHDLMKLESRTETIMTHQQKLGEMTTISISESIAEQTTIMKTGMVAYAQSGPSTPLIIEQPRTEQKLIDQHTLGEAESEIKVPHQAKVAIMKEAEEQGFQEHDGSKETIITILSKELTHSLEKEVLGVATASKSLMTTASSSSKTIKETREANDNDVHEEPKFDNTTKRNIPDVTPSIHFQSQIHDDRPSTLGICEILKLVDLKDGETALLAQALERYPQLLLPHEHRSQRMIGWSYRVLVDILVMLATKTPYTITTSEKLTLEANLCDASFLGFDKNWVGSVRAKVFGVDMSDVLAMEEEIHVMEVELETCDIALEQARKQRLEAKERLEVSQRRLEMAQSEFEAIDSQLLDLLEDRKELMIKIKEFKEITSAKDRPFGI